MVYQGTALSRYARAVFARVHALRVHHAGVAGGSFIARIDRLLLRLVAAGTIGPGAVGLVDLGRRTFDLWLRKIRNETLGRDLPIVEFYAGRRSDWENGKTQSLEEATGKVAGNSRGLDGAATKSSI